jgi:outer membrane protein TolC
MMLVNRAQNPLFIPASASALLPILILAVSGAAVAQAPNPTSAANPFFGSVTAHPASDQALRLSLDEAIGMGLKNNLGLKEAEAEEKSIHGQENQAVQQFLPTITLTADTGVYQHNLAALGFGPGVIGEFSKLFPAGAMPAGFRFSEITRDDLTEGQVHYRQMLFSSPVIAGFKAARAATNAAHFGKMSARGEVVQQVATAYLHAIAAASQVDNANALEAEDRLLLNHAHDAHLAGTVANLDELRARVQLQAQQQTRIAQENALQKDLILLKREVGVDPGQQIVLTDPAPYSELALESPEEVRAVAFKNRQDYQNLLNQVDIYKGVRSAYRGQRLPSLSFGGYYGVSEVSGVGAHGNFMAQGTLTIPIFREASLRGDCDAAQAQLSAVNAQLADMRIHIDQQVRSALLDAGAASKLVEVARSNVDLATRALSDETDRVNAGVDDNLPLVAAQAALAAAQTNLVESLYRYNVSKLALARASGVLEAQYRVYLGR